MEFQESDRVNKFNSSEHSESFTANFIQNFWHLRHILSYIII